MIFDAQNPFWTHIRKVAGHTTMQESRPLAGSTLDVVWLRRSRLLNSCLLVVGLTLGIVAGTSVGMQLDKRGLALSMSQAVLLFIGAAWLAVA